MFVNCLTMPTPDHIFSSQDYLFLDENNDDNLREIERFRPQEGKLVLVVRASFKEDNLLKVSKAFSFAFDKWKLENFWYLLPCSLLYHTSFI